MLQGSLSSVNNVRRSSSLYFKVLLLTQDAGCCRGYHHFHAINLPGQDRHADLHDAHLERDAQPAALLHLHWHHCRLLFGFDPDSDG